MVIRPTGQFVSRKKMRKVIDHLNGDDSWLRGATVKVVKIGIVIVMLMLIYGAATGQLK